MVVEYVVGALKYVMEEGTTLRRNMLCSRSSKLLGKSVVV